ncbi:hypothetical protein CSC18_2664 [Klebsiella aerogenes]|nr:hypothetical protein CSC18_2664 [Klebsiella aerogenes]
MEIETLIQGWYLILSQLVRYFNLSNLINTHDAFKRVL